ncbi:MAG TPA: hypothetical protein VJ951_12365, partial [Bacteroidales bacterium]|nr:hypothetical protein [Bacteroidales bacterium]
MRIFIIAGEASGDLHASNLMKAFIKLNPDVSFNFIGGDLMTEVAGNKPMAHYREMNFMGLFDVLLNIFRIRKIFKSLKKSLQIDSPDAIVLVDYAGFNLRVAALASRLNISVFYYISPKVWAWRESRVKKLRRFVDKMFVIFPFEKSFYKSHNMEVEYYGNPLADAVADFQAHNRERSSSAKERSNFAGVRSDLPEDRPNFAQDRPNSAQDRPNFAQDRPNFAQERSLENKPIIALLAGSRKQEIRHCLPEMIEAGQSFSDMQLVVAGAPSVEPEIYQQIIGSANVK